MGFSYVRGCGREGKLDDVGDMFERGILDILAVSAAKLKAWIATLVIGTSFRLATKANE